MAMNPRILVIRGGAIGDFILTLPAIKLLRENFPQAHLEILGYKHIVALAEKRFYADAARSIEYAALSRFFIPNAELAPELVEYFSSFQQIVSYLYDPDLFFETNLRRCGVKHFLHASPKLDDSAHAAAQLARPLESLALFLEDTAATLHPTAEDHGMANDFLRSAAQPIIAIHPGSGSEKKNWPVENWAGLGNWLARRDPAPSLLLVGGESDRASVRALQRSWNEHRVLLAEDMPLPALAAALKQCALFIGHDSGISHIAAAAGVPCVLLFGPTDPQIWAPANARTLVVVSPTGKVADLEAGCVQEAITRIDGSLN